MRQLQRRTEASRRRSHQGAPQPLAPLPSAAHGTAEAAILLERISALLDEREPNDA